MTAGNSNALVQTYLRWRAPLLRFLSRALGNRADAEDLVQESFTRWLAQDNADSILKPQAYVLQIAVNAMRERPRHPVASGQAAPTLSDSAPSAQDTVEYRQMLEQVRRAIDALPDKPRRAFLLHRLAGRSRRDIAQELEVSERMVSKYLAQAMAACQLAIDFDESFATKADVDDQTG